MSKRPRRKQIRPISNVQFDLGTTMASGLNPESARAPEPDWILDEHERSLGHMGGPAVRETLRSIDSFGVAVAEAPNAGPTPPPIAIIKETLNNTHMPQP